MPPFSRESTTDEVLAGHDLSGRHIVITGSSSGLGEESARALASQGARITMLARSAEKNAAAAERIRERVPDAQLFHRELDLTSLGSVRKCAEGLLADESSIDVLLNNAGVMCCPFGRTNDGFEMQLGTNHVGHFLLTTLLEPLLTAKGGARVVSLSSGGHSISGIDWDDPNFERRDYDPWLSYGQSKTANALFAVELDRRWKSAGVTAFAVHPGAIATPLGRHLTPDTMQQMMDRVRERAEQAGQPPPPEDGGSPMRFKSVEQGAATQCWAATAPELASHGGAYLGDCQLGVLGANPSDNGYEAYAVDATDAERLWALTEKWVGAV